MSRRPDHRGQRTVRRGATVGAGAILLPGIQVGAYAMIAGRALVDRDVPPHALVAGNPHRHVGWACRCGTRLIGTARRRCGSRYEHQRIRSTT